MGYYTKHIIRIVPAEEATRENYQKIINMFEGEVSFLTYHDGILDDSSINDGDGSKWFHPEEYADIMSKDLPFAFEIECIRDNHKYRQWVQEWGDNEGYWKGDDMWHYDVYDGESKEREMTEEEAENFEKIYGNCNKEYEYLEPNSK